MYDVKRFDFINESRESLVALLDKFYVIRWINVFFLYLYLPAHYCIELWLILKITGYNFRLLFLSKLIAISMEKRILILIMSCQDSNEKLGRYLNFIVYILHKNTLIKNRKENC